MQTIKRGFSLRTIESFLHEMELKINVLENEFRKINHNSCRKMIKLVEIHKSCLFVFLYGRKIGFNLRKRH